MSIIKPNLVGTLNTKLLTSIIGEGQKIVGAKPINQEPRSQQSIDRDVPKEEYEYYARFPAGQYLEEDSDRFSRVNYYPKGWLIDRELSTPDHNNMVYYNPTKKEVVYSIRGTKLSQFADLASDLFIGAFGLNGLRFVSSLPIVGTPMYEIMNKLIRKYKYHKQDPYKIILSSHSLGASLQQLLLRTKYDNSLIKEFDNPNSLLAKLMGGISSDDARKFNPIEYVDKVYAFQPGVGIPELFSGIIQKQINNLFGLKDPERSKLKDINKILYVGEGRDISEIISVRPNLGQIIVGHYQLVPHKFPGEFWSHSIYNFINNGIVRFLETIKEPDKLKRLLEGKEAIRKGYEEESKKEKDQPLTQKQTIQKQDSDFLIRVGRKGRIRTINI